MARSGDSHLAAAFDAFGAVLRSAAPAPQAGTESPLSLTANENGAAQAAATPAEPADSSTPAIAQDGAQDRSHDAQDLPVARDDHGDIEPNRDQHAPSTGEDEEIDAPVGMSQSGRPGEAVDAAAVRAADESRLEGMSANEQRKRRLYAAANGAVGDARAERHRETSRREADSNDSRRREVDSSDSRRERQDAREPVRDEARRGSSHRLAVLEKMKAAMALRLAAAGGDDARQHDPVHTRLDPSRMRAAGEVHDPQVAPRWSRASVPGDRPERAEEHDRSQDGPDRKPPERGRRSLAHNNAANTPAASRAEQVDTAVRLEQATGESARANAAPTSPQSAIDPAARPVPQFEVQPSAPHSSQSQSSSPASIADAARGEDSPVTSRIVRGMTAMLNQRGGSLTMRLDPPELGSLRVQMTLNRGSVSAQIVASTAQAHGLLENNLAMLKTALERHGLSVDRLAVQFTPGPGAPQGQMNHHSQGQQQDASDRSAQQDAQADAGGGESRGRREFEPPFNGGASEGEAAHAFSGFMQNEAGLAQEVTSQ